VCSFVRVRVYASLYSFICAKGLVRLQHTATHCNTLQTLQHTANTATHIIKLQHTATRCDTLQHTATHSITLQHTATRCATLCHTATHCNTLHPLGICKSPICDMTHLYVRHDSFIHVTRLIHLCDTTHSSCVT